MLHACASASVGCPTFKRSSTANGSGGPAITETVVRGEVSSSRFVSAGSSRSGELGVGRQFVFGPTVSMGSSQVTPELRRVLGKKGEADWSVGDKPSGNKGIKWSAEFGQYAYAGPVIADGKVFVGTGNARPRDPAISSPSTSRRTGCFGS